MRVLIVGVPDSEEKHFIFTRWIVKVKEVSATSCMLHMIDGSKYSFHRSAQEMVDLIEDNENRELQQFLDLEPGTDILQ